MNGASTLNAEQEEKLRLDGHIKVDDFGKTTVPGIYAAGDNCSPMRALAAAMSSCMKAGVVLNHELIAETF